MSAVDVCGRVQWSSSRRIRHTIQSERRAYKLLLWNYFYRLFHSIYLPRDDDDSIFKANRRSSTKPSLTLHGLSSKADISIVWFECKRLKLGGILVNLAKIHDATCSCRRFIPPASFRPDGTKEWSFRAISHPSLLLHPKVSVIHNLEMIQSSRSAWSRQVVTRLCHWTWTYGGFAGPYGREVWWRLKWCRSLNTKDLNAAEIQEYFREDPWRIQACVMWYDSEFAERQKTNSKRFEASGRDRVVIRSFLASLSLLV